MHILAEDDILLFSNGSVKACISLKKKKKHSDKTIQRKLAHDQEKN